MSKRLVGINAWELKGEDARDMGRRVKEEKAKKRTIKDPAQPPDNITIEQARAAVRAVGEKRSKEDG